MILEVKGGEKINISDLRALAGVIDNEEMRPLPDSLLESHLVR